MPKRNNAELSAEVRMLRRQRSVEAWALVVGSFFKWACVLGISRYLFKSFEVLAGKVTLAQIGVGFLAEIESGRQWIAWLLAIFGWLYGLRQRMLRKANIARTGSRIEALEKAIDPKRTSSGLTATGDTHPEDKT